MVRYGTGYKLNLSKRHDYDGLYDNNINSHDIDYDDNVFHSLYVQCNNNNNYYDNTNSNDPIDTMSSVFDIDYNGPFNTDQDHNNGDIHVKNDHRIEFGSICVEQFGQYNSRRLEQ